MLPFRHIVFETTQQCNLQCRYCYNVWHVKPETCSQAWTYNRSIKTLKRLLSVADVKHVTLSGGEPFLSERLSELVLFCRLQRLSVSVLSNGTAAGKEEYKDLIRVGTGLFQFPFHSYKPDTHDYLTAAVGSWDRVVQSICSVLELGGNVGAVIVLTRHNAADIRHTLAMLMDMGIRQIMLARFNIGGRGIGNARDLSAPRHALIKAFKDADDFASENPVNITSNVCMPFCLVHPKEFRNIRIVSCSANLANKPITIDPAGDVRLCNHSPTVIGNLFNKDIRGLLSSERVRAWNACTPESCISCDDWDSCRGGCRAASEQLGRGLECADPILEYA